MAMQSKCFLMACRFVVPDQIHNWGKTSPYDLTRVMKRNQIIKRWRLHISRNHMTEIICVKEFKLGLTKRNFVQLHCVNNFKDIWSSLTVTNQDKSKYLQYTFIYHFLSLLITILQILYYIRLFHAYEQA